MSATEWRAPSNEVRQDRRPAGCDIVRSCIRRESRHDPRCHRHPTLSAADHERAMSEYGRAPRRGPMRWAIAGRSGPAPTASSLPEILESYWTHGFYVFQGVVGPEELAELRADIDAVLSRAPVGARRRRSIASAGRRSTTGSSSRPISWARPLSDPVGGTDKNNGRHPGRHAAARARAECAGVDRRAARRQPAPERRLPAALRPSRPARRGGLDPGRRFRALQRSDLREGAGPRPVGRLAPGRHDALERAPTGTRARTASTS